jgi:hypothetical protein
VTCPYSEPKCDANFAMNAKRCRCGRTLRTCDACASGNRAFANFCRACGQKLAAPKSNWTGYRGGARRLGFNPHDCGTGRLARQSTLILNLGNECRALLASDGHLIAVAHNGTIEIADVAAGKSICHFQVQGPVTAQPCIHHGTLYLAAAGQLSAYSLGALTQTQPRVRPAWTVALGGTPIHALTPAGDRLYVTVASSSWREIQVIDNLTRPAPRSVHGAMRTSWLASERSTVAFFSQNDGESMRLHLHDRELVTRDVALQQVPDHPIAFAGGTIFGVFGDERRLDRIDASTGSVDEALFEDTQFFAVSADDEWDRELVVIDSSGVFLTHTAMRDTFGPYDRAVKGSPLIVRNSAVVIGMEDGRVRVYSAAQFPRHEAWLVGGGATAITAIASFENYVVAGNRDGVVEVRELA